MRNTGVVATDFGHAVRYIETPPEAYKRTASTKAQERVDNLSITPMIATRAHVCLTHLINEARRNIMLGTQDPTRTSAVEESEPYPALPGPPRVNVCDDGPGVLLIQSPLQKLLAAREQNTEEDLTPRRQARHRQLRLY